MKKLLIICILIVSLVFISGCTGEEKANAQTSTESPSSEHVINPTTILKGYQSSGYKTFATNEMNSVIYDFSYYRSLSLDSLERHGELYEGPLPSNQKRTGTYFTLFNEDNSVGMAIMIGESDSNSKFEDSFKDTLNNVRRDLGDHQIETNLVGDYSFLSSVSLEGDERILNWLYFAHENYIVSIYTYTGTNENIDLYRTEILKVAKKSIVN